MADPVFNRFQESPRITPLRVEEAEPDPMESVTLRFESGGVSRAVELLLDRTSRSQRNMLASLEAGQFYQPEVSGFFTDVLQPGDVMVDVRAHIGYYSLLAGRIVGPEGKVFAFEPEPGNYRRLRAHLTHNGLQQVHSFNVALGSVPGQGQLFFNAVNEEGQAFRGEAQPQLWGPTREERRRLSAEVVVLDHVLAGLPPGRGPRLIKLDAEGMEYEILKGGLRTIIGHEVPFIICEINRLALERMGTSEAQLRGFMRLIGYQVSLLNPDGSGLQSLGDDESVQSDSGFNVLFHR